MLPVAPRSKSESRRCVLDLIKLMRYDFEEPKMRSGFAFSCYKGLGGKGWSSYGLREGGRMTIGI